MTKEKKRILDYRDNTKSNKLKKFPKKVNNNSKKYESFNVLSETEDSIYSPAFGELTAVTKEKGQVFISIDKLNQMIQIELDKRFGKKEVVDI